MIDFKRIYLTDEIRHLSDKLLGVDTLPQYLLSEETYEKVVIEMKEDNVAVGLAYGVIKRGTDVFFLHFLFVSKTQRTHINVISLLCTVFKTAKSIKGVNCAVWSYTLSDNENDSRPKLVSGIPFCDVIASKSSKHLRIKTVDIAYIRKFKIFRPMLLKEKGYRVINWAECPENLKECICKWEQSILQDSDYVSPFSDEISGHGFDIYNSFVLVKPGTMEPAGWIMCGAVSSKELTIRYFYMYPEERVRRIAHSFATYVLDLIALQYEYLSFDIAIGNRQMEMIVRNYFEPITESSYTQCNLTISFIY